MLFRSHDGHGQLGVEVVGVERPALEELLARDLEVTARDLLEVAILKIFLS